MNKITKKVTKKHILKGVYQRLGVTLVPYNLTTLKSWPTPKSWSTPELLQTSSEHQNKNLNYC